MQYVAFLKGINVGGHNLISKETLQTTFTKQGFRNVATYKQSGNVIFETDAAEFEELEENLQQALFEATAKNIVVRVRSMAELEAIQKDDPFKNCKGEGASFLVTFLPRKIKSQLQVPVKIPKSTAEVIASYGNEVYSVSHGHGDGALPNPFVEAKLKVKATTRNWNIIRELFQKYAAQKTA